MIAFDADDTLWHNETIFSVTQESFKQLLVNDVDAQIVDRRLAETELKNLKHFGYGIKGFILSMIETALDLTDNRVDGENIRRILELGKEMLAAPVELLDHVEETISGLSADHRLILVTKGDLFDQESKLARSGLGQYFSGVEVVSEKNPATYSSILRRYDAEPSRFVMVGNSLKSDVIPVIEIGAWSVYIPYQITWAHEVVEGFETDYERFIQLQHIGQCRDLIAARR